MVPKSTWPSSIHFEVRSSDCITAIYFQINMHDIVCPASSNKYCGTLMMPIVMLFWDSSTHT